jgi:hypothetical protein
VFESPIDEEVLATELEEYSEETAVLATPVGETEVGETALAVVDASPPEIDGNPAEVFEEASPKVFVAKLVLRDFTQLVSAVWPSTYILPCLQEESGPYFHFRY